MGQTYPLVNRILCDTAATSALPMNPVSGEKNPYAMFTHS